MGKLCGWVRKIKNAKRGWRWDATLNLDEREDLI